MSRIEPKRWTIVALCCMLAAAELGAQGARQAGKGSKTKPAVAKPTPGVPSTMSGIYTNAQATRGRYVYLGSCKSCHSPDSHTGATFAQWWKGKQLSELFQFIIERMPKNDPGSLAAEDVTDVVAYLLKLNQMPAGKAELYPDVDSLKKFRIDVKSKSGTSTAKGGGAQP